MSRNLKLSLLALVTVSTASLVWAQAPTPPTKEHEMLAREAGKWDAEMKMWMAPDQEEPMVAQATETNTPLGPYWVLSEFKSNLGGVDFVGHAQMGYDPVGKKYVGTWIDTMTPYLGTMEGEYDAPTKTLTMISTARDPMTGKIAKSTTVTKYVDEDTRVFTIHKGEPDDDDRWKMMEINYKRAK